MGADLSPGAAARDAFRYACLGDGGDASHGVGEPAVIEYQGAVEAFVDQRDLAAQGGYLCGQGGEALAESLRGGSACGLVSVLLGQAVGEHRADLLGREHRGLDAQRGQQHEPGPGPETRSAGSRCDLLGGRGLALGSRGQVSELAQFLGDVGAPSASPMPSADKVTMPASSIAASISDAALAPLWARMNVYWASKLTYISPALSNARSQVANAMTRLPGVRPDPASRRMLVTARTRFSWPVRPARASCPASQSR